MSLCKRCEEYYAINSSAEYCSVCSNHEKAKTGDKTINLNLLPLKDKQMEEWVMTGIHSKLNCSECSLCHHEDKELINNYCCECLPQTCSDCNDKTSFCPECNVGKYRRISHEEIVLLLKNEFNPRSILKVLRESMAELGTRKFQFKQLICLAVDVHKATEELHLDGGEQGTAQQYLLHTIYCLCVDVWNIQPHFVWCCKGFGLEDRCKSYQNIMEVRMWNDFYSFMSRRVPAN